MWLVQPILHIGLKNQQTPSFLSSLFYTQKSTTASGYITAHMSRIHDLDWSYSDERQLTTCSHDASIKFWDTSTPREPTSSIKAGAQPLWRARNYVSRLCCTAGNSLNNAASCKASFRGHLPPPPHLLSESCLPLEVVNTL